MPLPPYPSDLKPTRMVLMSQGMVRPGTVMPPHWVRRVYQPTPRPTPSRRPNMRLSNPGPR